MPAEWKTRVDLSCDVCGDETEYYPTNDDPYNGMTEAESYYTGTDDSDSEGFFFEYGQGREEDVVLCREHFGIAGVAEGIAEYQAGLTKPLKELLSEFLEFDD